MVVMIDDLDKIGEMGSINYLGSRICEPVVMMLNSDEIIMWAQPMYIVPHGTLIPMGCLSL